MKKELLEDYIREALINEGVITEEAINELRIPPGIAAGLIASIMNISSVTAQDINNAPPPTPQTTSAIKDLADALGISEDQSENDLIDEIAKHFLDLTSNEDKLDWAKDREIEVNWKKKAEEILGKLDSLDNQGAFKLASALFAKLKLYMGVRFEGLEEEASALAGEDLKHIARKIFKRISELQKAKVGSEAESGDLF